MQEILNNCVAVLVGGIIGFFLVFSALIGNIILSPRQPTRPKGLAYECGMLPIGRNITQVHVRYYLFAILFLLFMIAPALHLFWQVRSLKVEDAQDCLELFRSNRDAGGLIALALFVATWFTQ